MNIKTFNHSTRSGGLAWPLGLSTCLGLALAATVCTTSLPVQAALPDVTKDYTIQTIEFTPPDGSTITEINYVGINDSGMVAMQYNSLFGASQNEGNTAVREKGVWKVINVPLPGTEWTGCGNPTASGQVPLCYADGSGNWHNAIYHQGRYTYLRDCRAPYQCGVQMINDYDIMTGVAFNPTPGNCTDPCPVVGGWWCYHGVLFDTSLKLFHTFDYPGAVSTLPFSVNNALQMVGWYDNKDEMLHAFFSEGGRTFVNIDPPGSASVTAAIGINNQGEICGLYTDASTGVQQGFLLRRGKFSAFDVPNSSSTSLGCITDNGHLSGEYLDTATQPLPHGFIATPRCDRR